jgi:hypothetical protein
MNGYSWVGLRVMCQAGMIAGRTWAIARGEPDTVTLDPKFADELVGPGCTLDCLHNR